MLIDVKEMLVCVCVGVYSMTDFTLVAVSSHVDLTSCTEHEVEETVSNFRSERVSEILGHRAALVECSVLYF